MFLKSANKAGRLIRGAGQGGAVFAGEEARADGGWHGIWRCDQDAGADFGGLRCP